MGKQWWDTLVVRVEAKTRGYILYLIPLYNLFNQAYGLRKEGKMLRPDMEAAFQAVAPFADQMFDFLEAAKHTFIYAVAQINQEAANRCGISLDSKRSLPRGSFDEFLQACQAGEHEKASKLSDDLTTLQFRLYDDPLADKRFCATFVVPSATLGLEFLAGVIQKASSIGPLVARVVNRPDGREGDQLIRCLRIRNRFPRRPRRRVTAPAGPPRGYIPKQNALPEDCSSGRALGILFAIC